eukprot:3248424-Rhodomonas_salina.1
MTSSGSPTTSDSTSPTTVAGYAAAASCPPLTSDRCLRTCVVPPRYVSPQYHEPPAVPPLQYRVQLLY